MSLGESSEGQEGIGQIKLPALQMCGASVADSFRGTAWAFINAAQCLAAQTGHDWPGAFLAGHALECTLKAHLTRRGWSESRAADLGHDLKRLWQAARNDVGLPIAEQPSRWCSELSEIYASPCRIRYLMQRDDKKKGPSGFGLNGIGTPPLGELVDEVIAVMKFVDASW
jgi:hypothetical protein